MRHWSEKLLDVSRCVSFVQLLGLWIIGIIDLDDQGVVLWPRCQLTRCESCLWLFILVALLLDICSISIAVNFR